MAGLERAIRPRLPIQREQVERVIHERQVGRRAMLQSLERGLSVLVNRDQLAVEHHVCGFELRDRRDHGGVVARQVLRVAGDYSSRMSFMRPSVTGCPAAAFAVSQSVSPSLGGIPA
jgi:hypothetical protein